LIAINWSGVTASIAIAWPNPCQRPLNQIVALLMRIPRVDMLTECFDLLNETDIEPDRPPSTMPTGMLSLATRHDAEPLVLNDASAGRSPN
jgi:hypothetical protein